MNEPRIIATQEHPPCFPSFWRAYDDRLGADASPYGEGATEAEAIEDLKIKLEEL